MGICRSLSECRNLSLFVGMPGLVALQQVSGSNGNVSVIATCVCVLLLFRPRLFGGLIMYNTPPPSTLSHTHSHHNAESIIQKLLRHAPSCCVKADHDGLGA